MFHAPNQYRIRSGRLATDDSHGNNGLFIRQMRDGPMRMIAGEGMGWEHVSVSFPNRCPSWGEMCVVKSMFWDEEDTVIQYHPPKSEYVNCHPYCLHLWRPIGQEIVRPPKLMVG